MQTCKVSKARADAFLSLRVYLTSFLYFARALIRAKLLLAELCHLTPGFHTIHSLERSLPPHSLCADRCYSLVSLVAATRGFARVVSLASVSNMASYARDDVMEDVEEAPPPRVRSQVCILPSLRSFSLQHSQAGPVVIFIAFDTCFLQPDVRMSVSI